jgi:tRNA 5-methylaminomethyl-2-thiouridine biosynthesis bifunctional protein
LAKDEKEAIRQQKLFRQGWPDALFSHMDSAAISDRLGVHMTAEGLFYPYAGAVDPRLWISRLLENIPCRYNVIITSMTNTASGIMLAGEYGHENREHENHSYQDYADIVVIAAGAGLSALWGQRLEPILPITANCGQVSHIPSDDAPGITIPISFGGYMARAKDGSVALGASYQRIQNDHVMMPADQISAHAENFARLPDILQNRLPHTPDHWQNHWGVRQSVRATTPDRQPMAGALGKGLYILGGLGSRGMVTAPILAEALAADMCGEASPLDTAMRRAVDPFRFSRRAGL